MNLSPYSDWFTLANMFQHRRACGARLGLLDIAKGEMIQFSDLTYIQCALIEIGIFLWSFVYTSHHRNASPSKLTPEEAHDEKRRGSRFQLTQLCALGLYLSLITGIAFNIWTAWIKYRFGLVRIPNLPVAWYIIRPLDAWNYSQAQYLYALEALGMLSWYLKNFSIYFLVGAWCHYCSSLPLPDHQRNDAKNGIVPRRVTCWADLVDYQKSLAFKLGLAFHGIIVLLFITLELLFTNNTVLNLTTPQLVILFQVFCLILLAWWTTFRLDQCGGAAHRYLLPSALLSRLSDVFKNVSFLGMWLTFEFFGLFLVDLDGVTNFSLGILTRKGYLDLCTVFFLLGYHFTIVYAFSILYPERSFAIDLKYHGEPFPAVVSDVAPSSSSSSSSTSVMSSSHASVHGTEEEDDKSTSITTMNSSPTLSSVSATSVQL